MKEAATTDKAAKEKADEEKKSAEADRKELLTKLGSYRCQSSPAASWITYISRKSSFNTASSHQTGTWSLLSRKSISELLRKPWLQRWRHWKSVKKRCLTWSSWQARGSQHPIQSSHRSSHLLTQSRTWSRHSPSVKSGESFMPTVVLNIEKKFDPNLQKLFLREQNQTTVDEDDDQGLDNHELLLHFLARGKETAQQRKMIGGTGRSHISLWQHYWQRKEEG